MARGVFLGSSGSDDTVVTYTAGPPSIVGRCGRCGEESNCSELAWGPNMSTLEGSFLCACGRTVRLSVSLGFKPGWF